MWAGLASPGAPGRSPFLSPPASRSRVLGSWPLQFICPASPVLLSLALTPAFLFQGPAITVGPPGACRTIFRLGAQCPSGGAFTGFWVSMWRSQGRQLVCFGGFQEHSHKELGFASFFLLTFELLYLSCLIVSVDTGCPVRWEHQCLPATSCRLGGWGAGLQSRSGRAISFFGGTDRF